MRIASLLFVGVLFFTLSLAAAPDEEGVSRKSSVIFNTLCSKCHEGECSGRLSFDTGGKKATNHIKRYVEDDNLTKQVTKEFFTLLNYMKTACSILMPKQKKWQIDKLSDFAIPTYKGYFIPLGMLKSATYQIGIQTEETSPFKVEVLSRHFEHFLDQKVHPEGKEQVLNFRVPTPSDTFLRIKSRQPLHIKSLKISTNP